MTPTETELKLSLPAEQADALRSHPALASLIAGFEEGNAPPRPRVARLINHYFDTDDRLLARHGMALRLRRAGGKWFQTLKTRGDGDGALSRRGEWEMPVAGPALELAKLRGTPLAELVRSERRGAFGGFAAHLVRLFTTDFRRESWDLVLGGKRHRKTRGKTRDASRGEFHVEFSLDTGTISAGRGRTRRTAPICEVEIELKPRDDEEGKASAGKEGSGGDRGSGGDKPDAQQGGEKDDGKVEEKDGEPGAADALLELAECLAGDLVLVPLPLSKAERGYALLDGRAAEPVKPKMPKAHKHRTAVEHFAGIAAASQCALLVGAHGFLSLPPAEPKHRLDIESDHAEFVHQARVAMRYLRSGLRAHREFIGRKRAGKLNLALRDTGRVLGEARDWDVFEAQTLAAIEAVIAVDAEGKAALPAVRRATSAKRVEAEATLRRYFGSTEFARTAIATERFIARLAGRAAPPVGDVAPKLLDRQHRRVFELARVIATLDAAHRHRLRIEVKRLRYTFEFFVDLYEDDDGEARVKHFRRALSDLQDELGTLNDWAVAVTLLDQLRGNNAKGGSGENVGEENGAEHAAIGLAHRRVADWVTTRTRKELPKIAALTVQLELAGRPWA